MHIIGLTGLIGSGKSLVAEYFASCGAITIDTDVLAHKITATNGIAIPQIHKEFGTQFIQSDGTLNRDAMRDLVFKDSNARMRLENILHPLIFEATVEEIQAHKVNPKLPQTNDYDAVIAAPSIAHQNECANYIIVVVPLLFKSLQFMQLIQQSLFVDSKRSLLVKRVRERNKGLSISDIDTILAAQTARKTQLLLCDDVIENNGDKADLHNNVLALHAKYSTISG